MNDAPIYTGVDIDPSEQNGMFDNEIEDEETKRQKAEQKKMAVELLPNAEKVQELLKAEIEKVDKLSDLGDISALPAEEVKILVLAKLAYKKELGDLYTRFDLNIKEAKK